jgi:hypothetical protein
MPSIHRDELIRRREELRHRSARLRVEWRQQAEVLRRPLGLVDQARTATQWLARHPEWPLGAAVLIVLLRPSRALRWAGYAWQGYGVYRKVQKLMAAPRPPGT